MSESPLSLFIVQINIGFIILFLLFDKNNSEHPFGITTLDLKGYNNVVKFLRYLLTKTQFGLLIKIDINSFFLIDFSICN